MMRAFDTNEIKIMIDRKREENNFVCPVLNKLEEFVNLNFSNGVSNNVVYLDINDYKRLELNQPSEIPL